MLFLSCGRLIILYYLYMLGSLVLYTCNCLHILLLVYVCFWQTDSRGAWVPCVYLMHVLQFVSELKKYQNFTILCTNCLLVTMQFNVYALWSCYRRHAMHDVCTLPNIGSVFWWMINYFIWCNFKKIARYCYFSLHGTKKNIWVQLEV